MNNKGDQIAKAAAAVYEHLHRRAGWSPGDVANVLARHWPDEPTLPVAMEAAEPASVVPPYTGPKTQGNLTPEQRRGHRSVRLPHRNLQGPDFYNDEEKWVRGFITTTGPAIRLGFNVQPGGDAIVAIQYGDGNTFNTWQQSVLSWALPPANGVPNYASRRQHYLGFDDIDYHPDKLPRRWETEDGLTVYIDDSTESVMIADAVNGELRRFIPDPSKFGGNAFGSLLWIGPPIAVAAYGRWVAATFICVAQTKPIFMNVKELRDGEEVMVSRRVGFVYGSTTPGNADCVTITLIFPIEAAEPI